MLNSYKRTSWNDQKKNSPDRTLMKTISQQILPAIIITLQEYERMAKGGESESSDPTENHE